MAMKKEYLECGIIRAPHGVRGIVSVESWCDSPKVICKAKCVYVQTKSGEYREMKITSASPNQDRVLLGIEGVDSREAAQAYKNITLYLKREDIPIPRGAMLIADMIGLPVFDVDTGVKYGEIVNVTDGVRYKLYTVKHGDGEVILPGVPEFIKEVSEERGMLVRPIPGFFD